MPAGSSVFEYQKPSTSFRVTTQHYYTIMYHVRFVLMNFSVSTTEKKI